MRLEEYGFTAYYHKYITIEADELTEKLNGVIRVTERDCYALCSSWLDEKGLLHFNVLSIGESWEKPTRGLGRKEMLGDFTMDEVCFREARIAEPDFAMIRKNQGFIEEKDADTDVDLNAIRHDARLDDLRDYAYPDTVLVGMLANGNSIQEYGMQVTGIRGPFLVGTLLEEPDADADAHEGENAYALPYMSDEGLRLFALFAGNRLSKEEQTKMDEIIHETAASGIDFRGLSMKN